MSSARSRIRGSEAYYPAGFEIYNFLVVYFNDAGQTSQLVMTHRPQSAALLFSSLLAKHCHLLRLKLWCVFAALRRRLIADRPLKLFYDRWRTVPDVHSSNPSSRPFVTVTLLRVA
jgi:hypothetical protein